MTIEEFIQSAQTDAEPSPSLSPELQALWHTKANNWEQAHDIAQEIPTSTGSWIHALLHLIEGDVGNAGYWFRRADKPVRSESEIDALWQQIAAELLA